MFAEQNSTTSETASAKPLPALKKRKLSPLQHKKHNFSFGNAGEATAIHFLTSKDFIIVDRNVRYKNNEIDIIAIDSHLQEIVFIEVKTRTTAETGHPSLAVNKSKIRSMQKVAQLYLKEKSLDLDYRFDTITITDNTIEHFENITWNN